MALTSVGHGLCHGAKVALPVMTLSRAADELGGTLELMGWAAGAFTLAMAASSVPAGLIGDRHGTSRTLGAYFVLTAAGAALCAVAPGAWTFLGAYALLGLAAGVFHPAGLGLLSLSVPGAQLGRAMGTFGVAGSVGMALMPLLMSEEFGWRAGFVVLAAASLVCAAATWMLTSRGLLLPGVPPPQAEGAVEAPTPARRRTLALLLLAMGAQAFLLDGFLVLYPETVNDGSGFVVEERTLVSAVLVLGAVGQWVGGLMAREMFLAQRYALLLLFLPLVLFGIASNLDEPAWPFLLMGSFAFLSFTLQPVENRLLASFTSRARRSTAYALKFVVALAVSSPAPVLVAALLADQWAYAAVWRVLALLGLVPVLFGVLFLRGQRLTGRKLGAGGGSVSA